LFPSNRGDAVLYTVPVYGGSRGCCKTVISRGRASVRAGRETGEIDETISPRRKKLRVVLIETTANPNCCDDRYQNVLQMYAASRTGERPLRDGRKHDERTPDFSAPPVNGEREISIYRRQNLSGCSDLIGRRRRWPEIFFPGTSESERRILKLFGNILKPEEGGCSIRGCQRVTAPHEPARAKNRADEQRLSHHTQGQAGMYPKLFTAKSSPDQNKRQCDFPCAYVSLWNEGRPEAELHSRSFTDRVKRGFDRRSRSLV